MSIAIDTLLTQRPSVCGGRLCIEGTRLTVHQIVVFYRQGLSPEQIADEYPQITLAHVYAALAYYHANRAEIDAELAAEESEAARLERLHRTAQR